jgi:hypothetical protein
MITPKGYWQGQSFDVVALYAAHQRNRRIAPTLSEPILAAIEGGEDTRDVRNAGAVLAETA